MSGLPSVRAWGDGKTSRHRHLIQRVLYGADGHSELTCATDKTVLIADSPEGLEDLWQQHGGKLLETETVEEHPLTTEDAIERGHQARAAILLMSQRCTCATDDPLLCPNYLPGDEEGDFSDDD